MSAQQSAAWGGEADTESMQTYEQLPDAELFFADTHPDWLATVATMHGMSPACPSRCRVLELGSATGANLIPMAEHLRQSEFVGIERSPRHVEMGQARIAELGLSNLQLMQQDLMEVTPGLGTFDYMICHGVYSWVPAEVQRKILQICRENLSPQGVAFISYNTYPGWKMHEMVRDAVAQPGHKASDARQRVAEARKVLKAIQLGLGRRNDPYAAHMRGAIENLKGATDEYVAHEYLASLNQPCYFREFVDRAQQAGLAFISEVDGARTLHGLSPEAQAALQELGDPLEREQYRDFVCNTRFRKSLLCHQAVKLDAQYSSERFRRFYFSSTLQPAGLVDISSGGESVFVAGKRQLKTDSALVKAALLTMAEAAPQRLAFDALLSAVQRRLSATQRAGDLAQRLERALADLFGHNMVRLFTRPIDYAKKVSVRPIARPVARRAALANEPIANFLNELVPIGPDVQRLIPLLDGTRDHAELGASYRDITAALQLRQPNAADGLKDGLAGLARASLLVE